MTFLKPPIDYEGWGGHSKGRPPNPDAVKDGKSWTYQRHVEYMGGSLGWRAEWEVWFWSWQHKQWCCRINVYYHPSKCHLKDHHFLSDNNQDNHMGHAKHQMYLGSDGRSHPAANPNARRRRN
jgi:hypothetical protein